MDALTCGEQNFMLQRGAPPDLLIILDRSGSMSQMVGTASKWDQVKTALTQTVTASQADIKWGLEFFPSDVGCGTMGPTVPVALNNASAVMTAINSQMPGGSTPTQAAVRAGKDYMVGVGDSNPKYLLLATDGAPNCATGTSMCTTCPPPFMLMNGQCCFTGICTPCTDDNAGSVAAIDDAGTAGIHTFVIGIATGTEEDGVLNQMAMAGGEARPTTPHYYQVSSATDLVMAINAIAGQIVSCSFALQMAPPRPDLVSVRAGNQAVPRDTSHMNGWDFGPGNLSIQFYGSWCTMLQGGAINDVHAIFGCPPVSIWGDDPNDPLPR
jgi:hypothetical protein